MDIVKIHVLSTHHAVGMRTVKSLPTLLPVAVHQEHRETLALPVFLLCVITTKTATTLNSATDKTVCVSQRAQKTPALLAHYVQLGNTDRYVLVLLAVLVTPTYEVALQHK